MFCLMSALYILVAVSAQVLWMQRLLMWFDARYRLPHCNERDFTFYCATWPVVASLIGVYVVWNEGVGRLWGWARKILRR